MEGFATRKEAVDSLVGFILRAVFQPLSGRIVDRETFFQVVARVKQQGLYSRGQEICGKVMALLRRRREVQQQLSRLIALDSRKCVFTAARKEEINRRISAIIPADFLRTREYAMLEDCDRYLRSLSIRLERLHANPAKDEAKEALIRPHVEHLAGLAGRPAAASEEVQPLVEEFRTMIEEYRISLFSPEIKTRIPVSAKRLDQQWQAIRQLC
jgi:ATP-dependent helicase HrpA